MLHHVRPTQLTSANNFELTFETMAPASSILYVNNLKVV